MSAVLSAPIGGYGTAEADGSGGNTCWYVTYGPAESPEILVAVVIEEGSMASVEAIPVGQAVLERYLRSAGGR